MKQELIELMTENIRIVEDKSESSESTEPAEPSTEEQVEKLAVLGQAISDPIRVRMLGMMALGRQCCALPESTAPEQSSVGIFGICVCEFESYFGMRQSKVSYHMKKLKEAGLVREERRGKWNYYSIDEQTVRALLGEATNYLLHSEQRTELSLEGDKAGTADECR